MDVVSNINISNIVKFFTHITLQRQRYNRCPWTYVLDWRWSIRWGRHCRSQAWRSRHWSDRRKQERIRKVCNRSLRWVVIIHTNDVPKALLQNGASTSAWRSSSRPSKKDSINLYPKTSSMYLMSENWSSWLEVSQKSTWMTGKSIQITVDILSKMKLSNGSGRYGLLCKASVSSGVY